MTAAWMVLISMLDARPPWLGISLEHTERACVAIKFVQPNGPAWLAGLRDGDCIATINSKKALEPDDVLVTIESIRSPERLKLVLVNGKTTWVPYVPKTPEAEHSYCLFRSQRDLHIRALIWHDKDNIEDVFLRLEKSIALGDVRRQLAASGRARVLFSSRCESKATVVEDDASDEQLLVDGTDVWFGFDHLDAKIKTDRQSTPRRPDHDDGRNPEGEIYYGP